jgi:hypothetical protein
VPRRCAGGPRQCPIELVTYLHRPADQAQVGMFLAAPPVGDRPDQVNFRHDMTVHGVHELPVA